MPDPRGGQQFQDGVEHPEAGAKDRHHDHVSSEPAPDRVAHGRGHGHRCGREVAQGLGRQEDADPRRHPAELLGAGVAVAQHQQRVLDERVFDETNGHGDKYTRLTPVRRSASAAGQVGLG